MIGNERRDRVMETKGSHVESVYMERRVFDPPKEFVEKAHIGSRKEYEEIYRRSIEDPQNFWAEMAEEYLDWFKKWDGPVEEYSFRDDIFLRYFAGGKLNVAYNCLDRYLKTWRKNKAALIWQGEPPEEASSKKICLEPMIMRTSFPAESSSARDLISSMISSVPFSPHASSRRG
jgi:hypothetical protein